MARSKKRQRDELAEPTLSRRNIPTGGHLGEDGSYEHIHQLKRWAQRSVLGHGRHVDHRA